MKLNKKLSNGDTLKALLIKILMPDWWSVGVGGRSTWVGTKINKINIGLIVSSGAWVLVSSQNFEPSSITSSAVVMCASYHCAQVAQCSHLLDSQPIVSACTTSSLC